MELDFELTASDLEMAGHLRDEALNAAVRTPVVVRILQFLTGMGIIVAILLSLEILNSNSVSTVYLALSLSGVIAATAYWLSIRIYRKAYSRHFEKSIGKSPIRVQLILSDEGIRTKTDDGDGFRRWTNILFVREVPTRIALVTKDYHVFIVPNHAFTDESQRDEFVRRARTCIQSTA